MLADNPLPRFFIAYPVSSWHRLRGLYITGKGTTLLTLDFHFYLLFKNTLHDFLRRAHLLQKFLTLIKIFKISRYELMEKSEKYEKRIVVLTFLALFVSLNS